MFFKKNAQLLGLDIGSSCIKVAELKTTNKGFLVNKFAMTSIPPGLIEDGQIIEMDALSNAIRALFKANKIKEKNVAISTGGSSVVVKTIGVASSSEETLLKSIRFEAEQYIPYDIEDMNIDFQILSPMDESMDESNDQMNVLLVAVKKDLVTEYMELTSNAGLHPRVIDVDSFAFQNIYETISSDRKDQIAMLVDVGVYKTSLNIIKGTNSLMMRDTSSGTVQIREEIMGALECTETQAEQILSGEDTESMDADRLQEICEGISMMWCSEIQGIVTTYQSKFSEGNIENIFLTGGGSLIKGFTDHLAEEISAQVNIFNPFHGMIVNKKNIPDDLIQRAAPFASIALGLALRKVDDK